MDSDPPVIELIAPPRDYTPVEAPLSWHQSNRVRVFAVSFILISLVGLAYTLSRPSVYESRATLLTSAKTAIDQISPEADIQHVAIQKQLLLGNELLARTSASLEALGEDRLSPSDIRSSLDVQPVADTNLVEMVATGENAGLLPVMINTWIDVYLQARADDIKRNNDETTQLVRDELAAMALKLEQARGELARFRQANDIISAERQENDVLSRLEGLNTSLNNALEEEVKAKSTLESVREAIARKDAVVPSGDRGTMENLQAELQVLKAKLAELDARYTRDYLALQPSLRVIPEQIEALEKEIGALQDKGSSRVLEEAEQAHAAARKTAATLRRQLNEHKQQVAGFTAIFDEHKALQSDLENLELLHRETQARLVQIETRHVERYPQVDVISPASFPAQRVGPNTMLNSLVVLGLALAASLFLVWLAAYLRPQPAAPATVTLSGIHLHEREAMLERPMAKPALARDSNLALESQNSSPEKDEDNEDTS